MDAYPSLVEKAAALLHSVARNRALVDGNTRSALALLVVFAGVNGHRLTMTNDAAYQLVIDVVSGVLDDVPSIAERLAPRLLAR